jgi:hypothetical protein
MAHTYDELRRKTVAELREIAQDTVQGASQMNKEHLLPALCQVLGVKTQIRDLQTVRARALDTHDHLKLKAIRRQLHHLNHQIRAHMH